MKRLSLKNIFLGGFFTFFLSIFLLSGCASQNDKEMFGKFIEGSKVHAQQQANVVKSKTDAIKDLTSCDSCTDTERALMGVIASRDIAGITTEPYDVEPPTLGTDVQKEAVTQTGEVAKTAAVPITNVITGTSVVKTALRNAGDTTVQSMGDSNSVEKGISKAEIHQENHATGITSGDNSPVTPHTETPSATTAETTSPDPVTPETEVVEEAPVE